MASAYGRLLKHWRGQRRVSQLQLSMASGVSTRHLSYIESGKSRPSQRMVLALAEALEVPLRERNGLLHAAGYAPTFARRGLDSAELQAILASLEAVLERLDPYPCLVLDRHWNVQRANAASLRLVAALGAAELAGGTLNMLELLFDPRLRPAVLNFGQLAPIFVRQLRREVLAGDEEGRPLLERLEGRLPEAREWLETDPGAPLPPVVPLQLRLGEDAVSLFTTITTLGTPLDVTLQELRLETYLPADAASEAVLRRLQG